MKKIFAIFSLLILAVLVIGAGCQQSGSQAGGGAGGSSFADFFGKGNAKCTATDGTTEVTWWLKNEDYKAISKEQGVQQMSIVKKGDDIYMVDQTGKCSFYNIEELAELTKNQQQNPAETIDSAVETYQGYTFSCVPGIVTDADIAKPSGTCEDLTAVLRQAMEQACDMCQQNPQAFGGNCSQYC